MKKTTGTSQRDKEVQAKWAVTDYRPEYTREDSPDLQTRLETLYLTIQQKLKHENPVNWSTCCYSFETRTTTRPAGHLGHTKSKTFSMMRLSTKERITCFETFKTFMLKELKQGITEEGLIRMPTINMRHGGEDQEAPVDQTAVYLERAEPEAPYVDQGEIRLEVIEGDLTQITMKTKEQETVIETQRQTIEALQKEVRDLKLEKQNWERRLLALEGLAGSYKTNLEEVDRRALLALAKCKASRMTDDAIIEELGHLKRDMRSRVEDLETAAEETKKLRDQENASLGKRNLYEPWESTKDVSEEPHPTPKLSGKELQKKIEKLIKKNEPPKKKSIFP